MIEARKLKVVKGQASLLTGSEKSKKLRTFVSASLSATEEEMSRMAIPRVIVLAENPAFLQAVRKLMEHAGLKVALEPVANHEELLSRYMTGNTDMILASVIPELSVEPLLNTLRQAALEIPVLLVGNAPIQSQASQDETTDDLNFEVPRYLPSDELFRLPALMEWMLRQSHRTAIPSEDLGSEMDRTAEILRDNQKLVTIGRLAGSIAHEINNPLEAVTNLLYLMEVEDGLSGNSRQYLTLAQQELARVVEISKQTLNFYREANSPVRSDVSDLVEEVMVLFSRKMAEKNLDVVRQYRRADKLLVYPGEIRQVLSNLITNAMEASPEHGRLFLRIRPTRKWSDTGIFGVRISIGDKGGGIAPEVRHRLGEPFFTTKGHGGTGLGLWVTRSIVHRYGGELQLRSSIGKDRHGSVFSIFLPTNLRPQIVPLNNNGLNSDNSDRPFLKRG